MVAGAHHVLYRQNYLEGVLAGGSVLDTWHAVQTYLAPATESLTSPGAFRVIFLTILLISAGVFFTELKIG